MAIFPKLVNIYEAYGYAVQTGLSPLRFPGHEWADIPFTYLDKAGQRAAKGGGIAIAEIYFLEVLFEDFHPKNIFVIGNAFGWSTVALALLNPDAKVVAIDACPRPQEEAGIHFTNQLAQDFGLNLAAVKAKSPDDVAATAVAHLDDGIDFAFIDGGHTNAQQTLDFDALKSVAAPDCAYLFHDVVNFLLLESYTEIIQGNPPLQGRILFRTPSGMAIAYTPALQPLIGPAVHALSEDDERVHALLEEGRRLLAEQRTPVSDGD